MPSLFRGRGLAAMEEEARRQTCHASARVSARSVAHPLQVCGRLTSPRGPHAFLPSPPRCRSRSVGGAALFTVSSTATAWATAPVVRAVHAVRRPVLAMRTCPSPYTTLRAGAVGFWGQSAGVVRGRGRGAGAGVVGRIRSRNGRGSRSGEALAACDCSRDCDCDPDCHHDCGCEHDRPRIRCVDTARRCWTNGAVTLSSVALHRAALSCCCSCGRVRG